MKFAGVRVGARTRFLYDGDVMEAVEIHCTKGASELLAREVRTETVRRFALDEVMYSGRARLLGEDFVADCDGVGGEGASVWWSAAPEPERARRATVPPTFGRR
jgi:hypothetical protein